MVITKSTTSKYNGSDVLYIRVIQDSRFPVIVLTWLELRLVLVLGEGPCCYGVTRTNKDFLYLITGDTTAIDAREVAMFPYWVFACLDLTCTIQP